MLQKFGFTFKRLTPMLVGAITIAVFSSILTQSTIATIPRPDNIIYQPDLSVFEGITGKRFLGFTPMRSQLQNTDWQLNSITIGSTTQATKQPITLRFTADSIGGFAGCNEYSAAYRASQNRIKIGGIATTEKICSSSQMQLEQSFLAKLETVQRYEIINHAQNLKLFFQQGKSDRSTDIQTT